MGAALPLTSNESRILDLLGQGLDPSVVASAIGVTPSFVSQLLSKAEFAEEVAERRFLTLSKHTERDNRYDTLEDKLLDKLENCLPYMHKPMEIVAAITRINAAKRRGASAPQSLQTQSPVIPLILPIQIIQQFQLNGNGQVVKAGSQDLTTAQPGQLKDMLTSIQNTPKLAAPPQEVIENVQPQPSSTEGISASG